MKLDEAIKILQRTPSYNRYPGDKEGKDALKLGIEALKYIKKGRQRVNLPESDTLPGETEEGKHE